MSENNAIKSAPELTPIFSFRTSGGGDIYVYLCKTEVAEFAVATFDDTSSEFAYAVQTLTGFANIDAENLILIAMKRWDGTENPFQELIRNKKAMKRLAEIFEYEGE